MNSNKPHSRFPGGCLALLTFLGAAGAQQADYQLNLDLKEDTYRHTHKLNFSQAYFKVLTLSANNEFSSKVVAQANPDENKSVIQKRATLNLGYAARKDLDFGCTLRGADDSDNRWSKSSNNYTFNANYAWREYLKVSQTVGGVGENRLNIQDNGVQYNTTATITIPERSGPTSMLFNLGSTGNNLQWGKLGFNGGGNISYRFTKQNKLTFNFYQHWSADKDLSIYSERQYTYTVNNMKRNLGIATDYDVGTRYTVGLKANYDQNGVETDDPSGLARSTDFSNKELGFGASLLRGDLGIMDLTGDYNYTTGSKHYEDKTRNEQRKDFNTGAQVTFKERLDSLVINGNLAKSSLYDADGVDDRDNLTIKAGVQYPWQVLPRLRVKVEGNVYINKMVYVHPQKSIDSKWTTLYKLEPQLFYQFSPRVTVHQTYQLSSRYIESIVKDLYDLEGIDDKLFRTFRVDNSATFNLSDRFSASLAYDQEHIENCRYEGGVFEEVFIRAADSRERRHAGRLNFTYRFLEGITLYPQYVLTYKKTWRINRDSEGKQVSETPSSYSLHTAQLKVEYTILDRLSMDFTLQQTLRINVQQQEDRDNYLTLNINLPLL